MKEFATTLEEITTEGYNAHKRGDVSNAPAFNPLVMETISELNAPVGDPRVQEIMSAYSAGWDKGVEEEMKEFVY